MMNLFKAFIKEANFGLALLVIFLAAGFAYFALPVFGNKALIVRSGSMQPTIGVGDLISVKLPQGLAAPQDIALPIFHTGEIIAFKDATNPKVVITHRIVEVVVRNSKVFYETKGDANNAKDLNLVSQENVIGRADYGVVAVGRLIAFTRTKAGLLSLLIFPAALVILIESVNLLSELKRSRMLLKSPQINSAFMAKALVGVLAVLLFVPTAKAMFLNSGTSTGNVFSAKAVFPTPTPSPAPSVNAGDVVLNELNWSGSTEGSSDEWIELKNITSHSIDISSWQITKWVSSSGGHEDLMLTIPTGKTIAAGGLFLIADKSPGVGTALTVTPDIIDSSVVLDNTELQVKIYVNNWNAGGLLVDKAGNKSAPLAGAHSTGNPKKFYSMERNSTPGDGTLVGSWHTATTSVNLNSNGGQNKGTPNATND